MCMRRLTVLAGRKCYNAYFLLSQICVDFNQKFKQQEKKRQCHVFSCGRINLVTHCKIEKFICQSSRQLKVIAAQVQVPSLCPSPQISLRPRPPPPPPPPPPHFKQCYSLSLATACIFVLLLLIIIIIIIITTVNTIIIIFIIYHYSYYIFGPGTLTIGKVNCLCFITEYIDRPLITVQEGAT